jgi:hypothetical protein
VANKYYIGQSPAQLRASLGQDIPAIYAALAEAAAGTVTSIGLAAGSADIVLGSPNPVTTAGNIPIDLSAAVKTALGQAATALQPVTGLTGSYTYASVTINASGQITAVASGTAPAAGANPTGTIGLAAVNGVATTFMRSDAAPALSQAIAPTWTAAHNFAPTSAVTAIKATAFSAAVLAFDFIGLDNSNIGFFRAGGTNGGNVVFYDTGAGTARGYIGFGPGGILPGGAITDFGLSAGAGGTVRITRANESANAFAVGPNGNVTIAQPSSGDTLTVAPSVTSGALIASSAALTTGAGAAAGTLTNAPSAGNPTKWIKINDSGTIRSIPAW